MLLEQNLLEEVKTILKKEKSKRQITGERFNIFSILKIEHNEVTTHNRFLAELLNPRGKHDQGDLFLQEFYNLLLTSETTILGETKKKIIEQMRSETAVVKAEHWLGSNNFEKIIGGSVDILIKTKSGEIRIENKIHAGDQKMQIARYCSEHEKNNVVVIYWTKWGTKPSKESIANRELGTDFFVLSHARDTISWLEACIRLSEERLSIKETLHQYKKTISNLTNQNMSAKIGKEIEDLILKNKETYKAAQYISSALESTKTKVYGLILKQIEEKMYGAGLKEFSKSRAVRNDGAFIPVTTLETNKETYDIGVNLELDNNHYFFCAVKVGENRNAGINTRPCFDNVSEILRKKNYSSEIIGNRNGYSLSGRHIIRNSFSFLEYLDADEEEGNELIDNITREVLLTISESELKKVELPKA